MVLNVITVTCAKCFLLCVLDMRMCGSPFAKNAANAGSTFKRREGFLNCTCSSEIGRVFDFENLEKLRTISESVVDSCSLD